MIERKQLMAARKKKGMSRAELARAATMQAGMIAWIETGRFIPYEKQARKIADALEWKGELSELFGEVE